MSQHIFPASYNGRAVSVQMGWDASLAHYFMTVTRARTDGRIGAAIYSNLSDAEIDGGATDPAHFWNRLAALGIECKFQPAIDEALRSDAASNVGNKIVRYGADGVVEEK